MGCPTAHHPALRPPSTFLAVLITLFISFFFAFAVSFLSLSVLIARLAP